jgi:carbon-monoxide dehydrogenase medium subunit
LDDATIKEAAALAAEAAEPKADHRGSVEYKRNIVRIFTQRGLKRAYERARGGG